MNPKSTNPSNSLQKNDSGVRGKLNFENNSQFNGYKDLDQVYDQAPLKPNYTKEELNNADIPDRIGKEIRAEKYRIFFVSFIAFCMIVISVFFIACYYGATVENTPTGDEKWLIPTNHVPLPGAMIPLLIVGLTFFVLSMIEYMQLLTNVKTYKGDLLSGKDSIPYFLIKSYKSLIARVYYANWFALSLYWLEGWIIAIFWIVKVVAFKDTPGKFNTELIIMYVLAGVTFLLQMLALITARYRKGNMNAYFNTQIVSDEQAAIIKKHANRIGLVVFLICATIIGIAAFIVWRVVRGKRKKLLP